MLASDQVGERAAAAAKATEMLKAAGWTWADVSLPALPYYSDAPADHRPGFWDFAKSASGQRWTQPTVKPKRRPEPEDVGGDPHWRMRAELREILNRPEKFTLVGRTRIILEALVEKPTWSVFEVSAVGQALMAAGVI